MDEQVKKDLKRFFEILKITEISDNDREFKPVSISSCRVMLTKELDGILKRLENSIQSV